jgi:16S rRNA (uracil1498-N3)-methyltransferase
MPAERYYHPEILEKDQTIHLSGLEHHHLVNVMRTRVDETLEIINGKGQLAEATLCSIEKKSATLLITSVITTPPPEQKIILAQGLPRLNRLEFIIEKGTELGMTEIRLFPAARSEKKELSPNQLERLHTLMVAAVKQCGRLHMPILTLMPPLKQWKAQETLFYGDITPSAPLFMPFWETLGSDQKKHAIFCIGPESGFSDEEVVMLKKLQAHGVKLHSNILRTDTAAIAALVLITHSI